MPSYRFDEFELIPDTRRLLHRGVDVAIGIRVLEVMIYLVENRARAIGRDELLSAVWGRADGGDATLAQAVLKARRALGDDGNAQNFIRTVARFGYQWVAATTESAVAEVREAASAPARDDQALSIRQRPSRKSTGDRVARRPAAAVSQIYYVIGAFAVCRFCSRSPSACRSLACLRRNRRSRSTRRCT